VHLVQNYWGKASTQNVQDDSIKLHWYR